MSQLEHKGISLAWRFVIWFAVIGLLPLAVSGYLGLRQNEEAMRKEALGRMSRLADKKTLQIKEYLAERIQDAELLARSDLAEQALSDLSHAYARHGAGSAEYRRAVKPFERNFAAYIGKGEDALFYDVFLITPRGEIVYTYKREPDFATNLGNYPMRGTQLALAFRESRMTMESSISNFEHYAPSNEQAAFVSAPVIREGRLLGVVAFQLDSQRIYRIAMDSIGLGATGETHLAKLTDAGDTVFAGPLKRDPRASMQHRVELKSGAAPMRKALSGQHGSGVELDYTGKQVAAAWRYLPELRWGVVVRMDAEEVFAPLARQQGNLLQALLALALLGGLVAYHFGRRMVVSLRYLAATADEIAGGDLGKRVDGSRSDEIGVLGRAFNRMAENLQALNRTLEDRIEERTRELSMSNEQLQEEIIEREQAEAEMLAARNELAATIDAIPDTMFDIGLDGTYHEIHARSRDLLAAPPEAMLGKKVADVLPGEAAEVVMSAIREALEHGHSTGKQFGLPLPQGVRWFELSVSRKDSGQQPRFIVLSRDITDRKRIEGELIQVKERYDYATAIGKVGTWDWHPETGELAWNDETFRLFGLKPGAVSPSFELFMGAVHPDDRESILAAVHAALYENKPYSVECRLITGNDEISFCHVEGKVEFDDAGKPARMLGTVQDITGGKLAQLELLHKQDLLNEAQRLGRLGSWELNLADGELRWSDEIYRILELDPAGFQPAHENFLSLIHPDDRDKVNRAYTQSLENHETYDIVYRLLMADGRIKWMRERCTSEFDGSGKPLRSLGAVQDITEQYLAAEQLRVAAATFETHEAIMITDASANIIRVNRAFTGITGYSQEEVLGKNPRILSSGRHDKAFYAAMWQQLLQSGSWTGEIWDRRKSGQVYPKWLTITAVKDEQGVTTEYVSIFSDITMRKQAEDEIRNLAFYDALTGLPNRRLMMDRFRLALSVSARSHQYGAVLFLDMDKFKTLNDTLGHDHGDMLLIEVARRIQTCVREMDTVARLGGDEFVVLVEEISVSAEDALQRVALIAEKIRASLSVPYQLKEHKYHGSPSIGVCLYRGNRESVDDLLKHADLAMYQAKDSGRNAVRFFDPSMQQAVEAHAATEADLRHAIPENQLRLHYQVQIDSDHRPLGAEALLRWVHPARGVVSPAQFIPVAEESSLILEIGQWVLEAACQQLALWNRSKLTRHLELAINVSAQQFGLPDFVQQVEEAVERHGVTPERLKLELTESVVLKDVADVVSKMYALKALGVKLSLDDFGTGYSSLAYLKKLPLDQIKIDRSFVRDVTSDPNDAVMVKTIIDMAQNFRLSVIAEGVETEAQLAFLRQNGCMVYQGYLFGKPVSAAEFEKLVRYFY